MRHSPTLILLMVAAQVMAQYPDLRILERPAEWQGDPLLEVALPALSAAEGADFLLDDHRITFHRAKPQFITMVHERHVVIRFGSRDAIKRWSSFVMPESLDPGYDHQDVPWEEHETAIRPRYYDAELLQFQARVLGDDIRGRPLYPTGKVIRQFVKAGDRLRQSWSYVVDVPAIMPGDTVEVLYKYTLPYDENWQQFNSARIFMHGELHKHRCSLLIQAHVMQGFKLGGIVPDSTWNDGNQLNWIWKTTDLEALADERNARPYLDVPHILYSTQQDADRYMQRHPLSGQVLEIPYWAYIIRQREASAHWWRRVALKRIPDGQNVRLKNFIEREAGGIPKDQPAARMRAVHNKIAGEFEFHWDQAWYDGRDGTLPKYGNMVDEGYVREIARYSLYSKLMSTLRLKYYTGYVMDKRIGVISVDRSSIGRPMDQLSPIWNNEYLFILKDELGSMLMHSKSNRAGLFADELPFYWQNTNALIGDVDKLWNGDTEPAPELITLPEFRSEYNERTTNIQLDVDRANGTMHATIQLLLSGQFSTLCRGAYLYGTRDSTVDPLYGKRLYDIAGVRDLSVDLGEIQQEPPFRMPIEMSFELDGRVEQANDTTWSVDISDLITHILPAKFDAMTRDLPYYFDFQGSDRCSIKLRCTGPVELCTDRFDLVVGAGATLHQRVSQTNANEVELISDLTVSELRITKENFGQIERLVDQGSTPMVITFCKE